MNNEFLEHSAQGTSWTKKNHKYIRKEGNRYIYPTDAASAKRQAATYNQNSPDYRQMSDDNRVATNRRNAANGVGARNQAYGRQAGTYHRLETELAAGRARNARRYPQASPDYKQMSSDHVRSQERNRMNMANSSQAYAKELSQRHAQAMRRSRVAGSGGSTVADYKKRSSDHRVNDPGFKERATNKYNTITTQQNNRRYGTDNSSNVSDYKQASYEHRQADPMTKVRARKHYLAKTNSASRTAANRAKAANGSYTDYKQLSADYRANDQAAQRRDSRRAYNDRMTNAKKRVATYNQGTTDYKQLSQDHVDRTNAYLRVANKKRKRGKKTVSKLLASVFRK